MKTPRSQDHGQTSDLTEEDVELTSLTANPRNPNKHPKEQLEKLVASLRDRGQIRPVLARAANRMLIGGHGVCEAAKLLGWTRLRVIFWNVDQPAADRAMLADNRLGRLSSDDNDRVAELLREISPNEWLGVGYNADEAGKLLDDLTGTEIAVRRIEASAVQDDFWISIRGPLRHQADVLTYLKTKLAEFPGVNVEMGTTAL